MKTLFIIFLSAVSITTSATFPSTFNNQTEIIINDGENQTIFCKIPTPLVLWQVNGELLSTSNDYRMPNFYLTSNTSLVVHNEMSSSRYGLVNVTCMTTNVSDLSTKTFHIWFYKAPKIFNQGPKESHIIQNVGVVLHIDCNATGYPRPKINWVIGKEVLNSSHIFEERIIPLSDGQVIYSTYEVLKNGTLEMRNPYPDNNEEQNRNFTCVAFNIVGQDQTTHSLFFGALRTYSFRTVLPLHELIGLEEKIDQRINSVFQKGKLFYSKNITSVDTQTGTITFEVSWKEKNLRKYYGDPVDVQKLANDMYRALKEGGLNPVEFHMNAPPAPPSDLTASDIKDDRVTLSWQHPSHFETDSYQVLLKTQTSWKNAKVVDGSKTKATLEDLDSDTKYLIKMQSLNKHGVGERESEVLEVRTKARSNVVIIVVIVIIIIAIVLIVAAVFYYRRKKKKRSELFTFGENPYEQAIPGVPYTHIYIREGRTHIALNYGVANTASAEEASFSWREIARDSIIMEEGALGQGEFGLVKKGIWYDENTNNEMPVAVKTVKDLATENDRKELLKELKLMADVGRHPNIVNLHGACSERGLLWVVVEFCEHGNLLSYLQKNRNMLSESDFVTGLVLWTRVKFAYDVANGMSYLQQKKIVHRDLAARNVLLGKDKIAKVSDFGLSRDIYEVGLYQKTTGGKLPVKWMAIESLQDMIFDSKSDVWSFGVLCWEIETAGMVPYPGVSGAELVERLKNGYRLNKSGDTPSEIYDVMKSCWESSPKARPTFDEIKTQLGSYLEENSGYLPVVLDDENQQTSDHPYVNYTQS